MTRSSLRVNTVGAMSFSTRLSELSRLGLNNEQAWKRFDNCYRYAFMRFVIWLGVDAHVAEDLCQEAMMSLIVALARSSTMAGRELFSIGRGPFSTTRCVNISAARSQPKTLPSAVLQQKLEHPDCDLIRQWESGVRRSDDQPYSGAAGTKINWSRRSPSSSVTSLRKFPAKQVALEFGMR